MNEYQTKIYKDLKFLCDESDSFFFKDENIGHHNIGFRTYRIFNYRLCSYSDFLNENALECRGVMFELDESGSPVHLSSLPMNKFFNYKENPFTESLDFSKTTHVMSKADGSLISSYSFGGALMLKSKGSLSSDQALDAMAWIHLPENEGLLNEIHRFVCIEHTVNMEWTSPKNRIVLGYEKPSLIILNVRNNLTGGYLDNNNLTERDYPNIHKYLVEDCLKDVIDLYSFIDSIPAMEGIEGYVLKLGKQMVKFKTDWYLARHRAKDSINSPKRLFKAIVGEEIDDILSLFHDDPMALKTIKDMTDSVEPLFNNMISTVEEFYEKNQDMIRKDYAIKAKGLDDGFMGLYMNMYVGRDNDYKEFAKKNYEMFIGEIED